MKYIITESRLEKVIFKFLDSKLEGTDIKKGKFSDFVFAFPGEDVGLLAINKYHKKGDNYLHIYLPFFEEIQTMFDMKEGDVLEAIGKYVESRYNMKVDYAPIIKRHMFGSVVDDERFDRTYLKLDKEL
jgi:hypothetical protein